MLEQRADSLEGVCIAAAEDGERARFGARDATGDGGVDVAQAGIGFELGQAADGGDRVAAQVDVDVAGRGAGDDAVGAGDRGLDLGRAGQGTEDDGAPGGDFRAALGRL